MTLKRVEKHLIIPCYECGKLFKRYIVHVNKFNFCGMLCRNIWMTKNTGYVSGMKGKKHSLRTKAAISETKIKQYSEGFPPPLWKGEKVGYRALHRWVVKKLGNPEKCEHCGKTGLKSRKIGWANKNHEYKRNLTDWIRLCVSCHYKYDKKNHLR